MKSEKIRIIKKIINKTIIESLEYWILLIFFAANFEIGIAIKKDKIPETRIVTKIMEVSVIVISGRSFETATAAPVRVFSIEYKVIKDNPITIVFIAPIKNKNSLWSFMFKDCWPIIAACAAPNPGRKAVNGLAIIEDNTDFKKEFFESLMFFMGIIFCSGICVFCLMLIINPLAPKSPVNKGSKGS